MPAHFVKLGDVVRSVSTRGHQTDTLQYGTSGRFPIVDQSPDLIAGYSDDEEKVLNAGPVVVFGDHTRTVKFVDFPFVVGADGTKVLQPADHRMLPRFLAYAIEFAASQIPNLGYSRHFKELKDASIWVPPRDEQDHIVEILQTWDEGLHVGHLLINTRRLALRAARLRLVEQAEAEPIELGLFATNTNQLVDTKSAAERGLEAVELEHLEEATGRIVGRTDPSTLKGARRAFGPGDVLFGRLRPYLRKFAHPDEAGVCSTEIWVLSARHDLCLPGYLYQIVQSELFDREANKASGSRMPRADWDVLSEVPFPLPSIERQAKVVDLLAAEETAINLLVEMVDHIQSQRAGLMTKILFGALGSGAHQPTSRTAAEVTHA